MIKATRKPLEEISSSVKGYGRVLVLGCGGCTSVCLAGGQRESLELADDLALAARAAGSSQHQASATVERQCNPVFLGEIAGRIAECDCVLSTACGAGVQGLSDAYPTLPVFPALDTLFIGVDIDVGLYEERCRHCSSCMLAYSGGICPVTRCAKSLFNGPCGGTRADGGCEVGEGKSCAWLEIHDRLKAQGRLASILSLRPPMDWVDRGPAILVQRGYEERYATSKVATP
ncbi:MAG: methylenetetrahydrofolate reductase C-terminal domain-containing protein [Rectinemataceae bacterium]